MVKMDPNVSPTVAIMRQYRIPLTRENYLACGGYEELDAEQEAELPLQFRLCEMCRVYPCI
jgi:hypothetical protein